MRRVENKGGYERLTEDRNDLTNFDPTNRRTQREKDERWREEQVDPAESPSGWDINNADYSPRPAVAND